MVVAKAKHRPQSARERHTLNTRATLLDRQGFAPRVRAAEGGRVLAIGASLGVALGLFLAALGPPAIARPRPPEPIPRPDLPAAYGDPAAATPLPAAELDHWWRLFDDPTLDALEDEAFRAAPDALTAIARMMEARETRSAQTAATFPSGSLTGNVSRQKAYAIGAPPDDLNPTSGITDTALGNLNVSWELDLFGRLRLARRVAAADAAEARFDVEGTRAALAADVADSYFQTRGLAIRLDDARQTARIQRDLLKVALRKAEAGAGPPDEVDRVAGELAQAEAQAADLSGQLEASRRQLLILVGRGPRDLDAPLAAADLPAPPPTPAALPADLLARRPDVREAEFRLRAGLGAARLAHLAIFPTITLLPGLGLNSTAAPTVSYIPPTTLATTQATTTAGFWNLGVGVSAPTLAIPKLLYQARAEDARAREAAIAYQKAVRTAFGEARDGLSDLAAGERATSLLAAGEIRARQAYDAAQRRYAEGLGDLTTTLSAEQAWRGIRSALTAQRVDTLRRAVRTYKALGGGWDYAGAGGKG
jgi:NodT family efflux transporter outer membrane factor (OMF) lipoprotein